LTLPLPTPPPTPPPPPYTTPFRSVSAVSRQLQRTAAESKGRMKNKVKGLLQPTAEKAIAVNTAMSIPWVNVASRASSHQFFQVRSEEHTSELQSPYDLVCRLLLEK